MLTVVLCSITIYKSLNLIYLFLPICRVVLENRCKVLGLCHEITLGNIEKIGNVISRLKVRLLIQPSDKIQQSKSVLN